MVAFIDRTGEINTNNQGEVMVIKKYNNSDNIIVEIQSTGELITTRYSHFKNGDIKSHFSKTIFGEGIIGKEKTKDDNGNYLKSYVKWTDMLRRCYDSKFHKNNLTYRNCEVCEEWKYYSNFKEWFINNYYEIEGEIMCLDKDILNKNNKIYSSSNCVFCPKTINSIFVKKNKNRGKYPIGVCYDKSRRKYSSSCSTIGGRKKIGSFNTPEEAFYAYKEAKEKYIKQVADEYKDKIPQKLYEAMYRYEVEITD